MQKKIFKTAFPYTVPIMFGYVAIGIPFGLNVVIAGYPWWLALMMSLFMYAGAGQYMAIGLFASGVPLPQIVLTEFLLNIRHIVYGLSLITPFKKTGIAKLYLIFGLTDETYALESSVKVPDGCSKKSFYFTITFLDQCYWVLGTLIGALACSVLRHYNLDQYLKGVDFSLTALFVVLMIDQLKKSKDPIPSIIGVITCGICIVLYRFGILKSSNIILTAIVFGIAAIFLVKGKNFFRKENLSQDTKKINQSENSKEENK